jgi:dephospho-CoA kinase
MPSLGITGTIGSGKSYALEVLADLGCETIQADRVGHTLLHDPAVITKVIELLGNSVVTSEGHLDRAVIGQIIFEDREKRIAYNQIVHPGLLRVIKGWLAKPRAQEKVVVVEAALIPDWKIEAWFDEVWWIRCSDATALARWKRDTTLYWKIREAQSASEMNGSNNNISGMHHLHHHNERIIDNESTKEDYRRRIEDEYTRFKSNSDTRTKGSTFS